MKFSRELLLDAHQGTVLLDVSVLVRRDREEEEKREWKEDLASKRGRKAPPWSPALPYHCDESEAGSSLDVREQNRCMFY